MKKLKNESQVADITLFPEAGTAKRSKRVPLQSVLELGERCLKLSPRLGTLSNLPFSHPLIAEQLDIAADLIEIFKEV